MSWLCAGDFNEIFQAHEILRGCLRLSRQMEDFRAVLDDYGFQDLGYIGNKFTWYNGHKEGYTIWKRLNRAVATTDWIEKFPATKVLHLECGSSNHKPLIILPTRILKGRRKSWWF